jgi:hypothetical protein
MIATPAENNSNDFLAPQIPAPPREPAAPTAIAPAWHTFVLVAVIVALSVHGATRFSAAHEPVNRLATYGLTALMEAFLLGWVLFGLRLRKISLRSLLGVGSFNLRSIAADLKFAALFWILSLAVLGSLGATWSGVESALAHHPAASEQTAKQTGGALAPDSSQLKSLRALKLLAPGNGREIAAWTLLCILVGFVEEVVFRGYLQRQFIGWARGRVVWGVLASAAIFGGAHGYQGTRNMVLLAVFGALFSVLALYRRSLRAGIFAHTWHDLIAGLLLSLLCSHHVI